MSRLFPPIRARHTNLLVALTATAFFHLALGVTHLVDPERYTTVPQLARCYEAMPAWAWGVMGLVIWVVMTVGAYRDDWRWVRLALFIGLFSAVLRGVLIEIGAYRPGAGLVVWGFIAAIHYVQMAEPPKRVLYDGGSR